MSLIELRGPQGQTQQHTLPPGHYRIGASRRCDVHIDDSQVSRYHANLVVSEGGGLYLEDADSTNGTWQGEKRVRGCSMAPGDSVRLGSHVLHAVVDEARADSAPRPSAGKQPQAIAKRTSPGAEQEEPLTNQELVCRKRNEEVVQFKSAIHERLLRYLEKHKRRVVGTLSEGELRAEVREAALQVIKQHSLPVPKGEAPDAIIDEIVAEAVGLGPLEPFMLDETISEIMVNGRDTVYVERQGRISETNASFNSDASLLGIIERIVTPLGRRIDQGSPMVDARLPDGSRVNAIIPPLALNGPTLTIRKFFKDRLTMEDLIDKGTMSPAIAEFLKVCVQQRKNIVVSGGTGSGKTTTLNVLSNFIPGCERIVTIEDAAELQLHQEHVVTLEARPANVEGKGEVSIRDLVKNALRMRPDRIVVGECRGGEALDMLQAMNTGHDGSLTTGHANSPRDLLARLEVLILMAGYDLPLRAVREQIASAVDIVVQQTRFSDGTRRITSVMEVTGMEEEVVLTQPIFEFCIDGRGQDGRIEGRFTSTGDVPNFYQQLRQSGVELDWQIFREE